MIKYYAQIDVQNVCVGVSQLAGVVDADNLVELDSYNISVLGKVWQGGKWVDNPNKPTEPEPPQPVTNEQLQADIKSIKDDNLALMMGVADLYAAVTSVSGGEV